MCHVFVSAYLDRMHDHTMCVYVCACYCTKCQTKTVRVCVYTLGLGALIHWQSALDKNINTHTNEQRHTHQHQSQVKCAEKHMCVCV